MRRQLIISTYKTYSTKFSNVFHKNISNLIVFDRKTCFYQDDLMFLLNFKVLLLNLFLPLNIFELKIRNF